MVLLASAGPRQFFTDDQLGYVNTVTQQIRYSLFGIGQGVIWGPGMEESGVRNGGMGMKIWEIRSEKWRNGNEDMGNQEWEIEEWE